ncbi:UNVERIFIED_CONTAM: hypothetical protein GTU68_011904 [Idotea baltica]|nr:hypothetical protein [Idotea baltica]
MSKKGFIFDLDGVIVDTAKYHFLAWRNLALSIGVDFTEKQNEQLKGISRVNSLNKILAWGKKEISRDEFTRLMDAKNDDYLQYVEHMGQDEILPDVERVLNYLTDKKQGVGLGSASKNASLILEKVKLLNLFEALIDGNDVVNGKPDPEVFLKAANDLKIEPKDCIVFEDSVAGIQAANTAGMFSIGIGESDILHEADVVFRDFTEMSEDFLRKLIENY